MSTNKITRCTKCNAIIDEHKAVMLECSNSDGKYYRKLPQGHVSQGWFAFGADCAKHPNSNLHPIFEQALKPFMPI